ncbi:MAG: peptidase M50 [Peptococcaceae bacterium]|nr:peptidase M50 [Peptococcaceae bacterium]
MQIKGVKIKIHPTFIVLLLLLFFSGLGLRALLVFLLVILHELAHTLAAVGYGVKVKSLELYPYGGTAVFEDTFEGNRIEESVIAFAGPALNLAIFFGLQYLRWLGLIDGDWVLELLKVNFLLACFNLIPVLPLDGGRIARAFLARTFGFVQITKFLAACGKWLGGLFVILGFVLQALGFFIYEPGLFLVLGVFFLIGSSKEEQNARIVFLKQLCRKKEQLLRQGLMRGSSLTVAPDTPLGKLIDQLSTDRYCLINIIGQKDKIEKVLSESELVQGMIDYGLDYPVGKLLS